MLRHPASSKSVAQLHATAALLSLDVRSCFFFSIRVLMFLLLSSPMCLYVASRGLVILFPLDPLYLLSLRSPLLSNLHPFLSLTLQPFFSFSLKPSILLSGFPPGLPEAPPPLPSLRCLIQSPVVCSTLSCSRIHIAPFFTPKPFFSLRRATPPGIGNQTLSSNREGCSL